MDSSLTTNRSLASLRDFFSAERILICFNGPTSRTLISEIGVALKEHIESSSDSLSAAMDVFSVYIEMSQNIRHYASAMGYVEPDATATVVILKHQVVTMSSPRAILFRPPMASRWSIAWPHWLSLISSS